MLKIWIIGIHKKEKYGQYSRIAFNYIEAIEATGLAIPYIIPCNTKHIDWHIENCDGFIFPWWQDIDPKIYNKENCGSKESIIENDIVLLDAIQKIEKTDKLLFGICRGMQLINVYYEWTLIQHIENSDAHDDIKAENRIAHDIILWEWTFLREAFWTKKIEVNSIHHQAIEKLWEWIESIAHSDDGYIEWIQVNGKNILWVQWHPELLSDHRILFQTLFEKFINNTLKNTNVI